MGASVPTFVEKTKKEEIASHKLAMTPIWVENKGDAALYSVFSLGMMSNF
jgi:hypothetical protein